VLVLPSPHAQETFCISFLLGSACVKRHSHFRVSTCVYMAARGEEEGEEGEEEGGEEIEQIRKECSCG
jgi:hypothetical protein